ncbi:MAG TPA: AAA family ATPase [Acidimicrobiia bacterium]|jgi:ATP/maltotriose-dependent transcriptional regulator MalT|nr:AAA family ATPase [Acidimicrobiia bacterium]
MKRRKRELTLGSPWKTALVGRTDEIAELEEAWRLAGSKEGQCVLMVGDPGVGKTRLASELLGRRRANTVALTARAYPLAEAASFGIWAEALDHHLRGLPAEIITDLCGAFLDELAVLVTSVATVRGPIPGRPPPRLRLFQSLETVLANLAAKAPVLVVLDDMHLADASSWEALHHVVRNLSHARVLVVVTARPAELAEHPLATRALDDLERQGLLHTLELGPLESDAVSELAEIVLGERPSRVLNDWLEERARGNPLFVLGLLQALLDEGADLTAPGLPSLPEELSERVSGQIKALDQSAVALLELLAVIGSRVEPDDLATLTGQPLHALGATLEKLVRCRLVLEEERGRELTYEFAHPLFQEAVYQGIGRTRRRALHRGVGRALLASHRFGEAAPHFARSAKVGDREAIDALREGLRQAQGREAHREALTILGALVELLPPNDDSWLEVLTAMSWGAEWVVDHRGDNVVVGIRRAMGAIDGLLEDTSDLARRAAGKFNLAHFLILGAGDLKEAERTYRQALGLFEQVGDTPRVLLATNELAWIRGHSGDLAAQQEEARQVLQGSEAAGEWFASLQALGTMGFGALWAGRFRESESAFRRSISLARRFENVSRVGFGLSALALSLAFEGRVEEALLLLEEAKSDPAWRDSLLLERAIAIHWVAGDFPASLATAQQALAWNQAVADKRRIMGMVFAAMSAAETDQIAEAERYVAKARAAHGSSDWALYGAYCRYAEALVAYRSGKLSQGLTGLRAAATSLLGMGALPCAAFALLDFVQLAAQSDELGLAGQAISELQETSRTIDRKLYRGLASLASSCYDLTTGNRDRAAESARTALELFSTTGAKAFMGQALGVLAAAISIRDRAAATQTLDEALATFKACGANWHLERAREILPALPGQGSSAVQAVESQLTARELQVARLAAKGLSNRDIAARLFVSTRTVENHLHRVYSKLGISTRKELVSSG